MTFVPLYTYASSLFKKIKRRNAKTAEAGRFVDVFTLRVFFYFFLYKSFEIDVEDERNLICILELSKFKNIFRFLTVVFYDTYVGVDPESLFESLGFVVVVVDVVVVVIESLLVSFRLSYNRTRKGDAKR